MVGNETGSGHICGFHPSLRCSPECGGFGKTGVSFLECRAFALAGKPLPADGDAKDQATSKAAAEAGLHDAERSRTVLMVSPKNPALGALFLDRMVHRESSRRDNGPEVVDGES